ncbi:hypothetical protein [Psychrobacter lutiphocae]|uniref:hypothetical protein n=1 Tax=Psychrobacter lutiphocae TaxID=540500 RepID=UPI0003801A91|nr:hypothetical protein [Psychrobacter lutiphocae]
MSQETNNSAAIHTNTNTNTNTSRPINAHHIFPREIFEDKYIFKIAKEDLQSLPLLSFYHLIILHTFQLNKETNNV